MVNKNQESMERKIETLNDHLKLQEQRYEKMKNHACQQLEM